MSKGSTHQADEPERVGRNARRGACLGLSADVISTPGGTVRGLGVLRVPGLWLGVRSVWGHNPLSARDALRKPKAKPRCVANTCRSEFAKKFLGPLGG